MCRFTCPECQRELSASTWPEDRSATAAKTCGRCLAHSRLSPPAKVYESRHAASWRGQFSNTILSATSIAALRDGTGMPTRMASSARVDQIQNQVKQMLPGDFRTAMADWSLPFPGGKAFGLHGATAVGKSFAIASYVRRWLWIWLDRAVEHWDWSDGQMPDPSGWVTWVTWPRAYSWIQGHALQGDVVDSFKKQASRARLLVLDDLGREGAAAKSTGAPFAHRVLDDVLSLRYDRELPIIWTSNNANEFSQVYDAALVSRIFDAAPIVQVGGDYLRSY